jgi:hypothetical protein
LGTIVLNIEDIRPQYWGQFFIGVAQSF